MDPRRRGRAFAILMWVVAGLVIALVAMSPAMWRVRDGWRRVPRLLAYLPVGLLVLWIGNAGGLAFWS